MTSASFYRVGGESFQASPRRAEAVGGAAQVRLADIHVSSQPDGNYQAVASFDLEPPGNASCVLQLPLGSHLRHASVDQLPAQLIPLGQDRWQISLGPPELPQRIEIIYTATSQMQAAVARSRLPPC